jgi:hypothetical protein
MARAQFMIDTMPYDIFLMLAASPSASAATPAPGAEAEVVDWGSDKDEYKVGETATVWVAIKNTGEKAIEKVEIRAGVEKEFLGSFVKLISDRLDVPIERIGPGETRRFAHSATTPNFPGKYRITVKVVVDGKDAGDYRKVIAIKR